MNSNSVANLILVNLAQFGLSLLAIIGACLVIGVGVIIFNIGWNFLKHGEFDKSGRVMGFYYASTPWRGYNRWRSQSWNEQNTL